VRPAPDQPRYNPGTALLAWVGAFTVGVFGSAIVLAVTGYSGTTEPDQLPLWVLAVTQLPAWLGLIGAAVAVSRLFGTGHVRDDFGLRARLVDLWGLPIGVVVQLVFVPILYAALRGLGLDTSALNKPAKALTDRAADRIGLVLVVLIVVVGAPIVEELFFRGLVLRSIAARYSDWLAISGSAVLFALIHFQLLQFPGLALFGVVVGYCAHRTRRLGMGILAHASFNATTVIVLLRR
jgi:uncharacterized protein